jgi:hypothetical protein
LLFGHNVRGPLSLIKSVWADKQSLTKKKQNVIEFMLKLRSKLAETRELAVSASKEAKQQSKTWYDRKSRQKTFATGDKVMLLLYLVNLYMPSFNDLILC